MTSLRRRFKLGFLATREKLGDYSAYEWVEFSQSVKRAIPPKMIRLCDIEAERAKTDNRDLFISRYRYRENKPYFGPVLSDFYIDFDALENPALAHKEAQKFEQFMCQTYNLEPSDMTFNYTGSKGFCVEVPFQLFGVEPSEDLPLIWRHVAKEIADAAKLKHVDFSVYERMRLWRLRDSYHTKGERYKIQLARGEIDRPFDEIKELAKKPRGPQPEISVAESKPKLRDLYEQKKALVEAYLKRVESKHRRESMREIPKEFDMSRVFHCVKKRIKEGILAGTYGREPTAFYVACALRQCGATREQTTDLVREFAGNCKPPLSESDWNPHAINMAYDADGYRVGHSTPCFAEICEKDCQTHCFIHQGADLSDKDREEAKKFLEDPKLLANITSALGSIVGEDANRILLFLLELSKQSVEVQGKTAAGKNTLVETVLDAIPPAWWEKVTGVTDKALRYLGKNIRTLYMAERGAMEAHGEETTAAYDAKLVISEGKLKILVPQKVEEDGETTMRSVMIESEIENLITTTTQMQIPEELENRMWVMSVDQSQRQNERVRDFKLEQATKFKSARLSKTDEKKAVLNAVLVFDEEAPEDFIIPFAAQLKALLKVKETRVRRDTEKLLALMNTIARLHYKQRPILNDPKTNEPHIVVLPEDFWYAMRIGYATFIETITGMTRQIQEGYDAIQDLEEISTKTVMRKIGKSDNTARKIINALETRGLITQINDKKPYLYALVEANVPSANSTHTVARCVELIPACQKETESFLDQHQTKRLSPIRVYDPLTAQEISSVSDERSLDPIETETSPTKASQNNTRGDDVCKSESDQEHIQRLLDAPSTEEKKVPGGVHD